MTHLIEHWQRPAHVLAMQTTCQFKNHHHFSAHPNHIDQSTVTELVSEFHLPHVPHYLHQVHGNQVIEYQHPPKEQMVIAADACFTRQPNLICAIMTADCLPVLLTDSVGSFVAAVHCGWRSLYAEILAATVSAIKSEHEIMAWLGPCIQQPQYEVDADFVTHYLNQHPKASSAFGPIIDGKSHADLIQMAVLQLNGLGISQITQDGGCTAKDPNYHSWRADQTPLRMASMIWRQPVKQST